MSTIDYRKLSALALALGPVVGIEAFAEVFMSDNKAAEVLFPGVAFEKKQIKLEKDDVKRIEKNSGETVRGTEMTVFRGPKGETVYIDRVLGKHEFITYAVGIGADHKVTGIEILEYRESYGHEIKRDNWRAQFKGKDMNAAFKLDEDVKNISGATLSCGHVARGVKRVLQTHDTVRARLDEGKAPAGNVG